jgi:outer membrane protein assembly factor BamB
MRYFGLLIALLPTVAHAEDWPQWLGPKRDGVWRDTGIADKLGTPKELWRKPIGQGYAGPAVANGKVFVTDRFIAEGAKNSANPFDRKEVAGKERILCFDEASGEPLWKHEYPCAYRISYPSGPRCTPTVDGDRVYALGAMGDLYCLGVEKGNVIWEKHFLKDYDSVLPVWGFAAHPLVDGDSLICLIGGSDGRMVVALDKKSGKEIWHSLTTEGDFGYCPPMIFQIGKTRQLIIWHTHAVAGLNPEDGKKLWSQPFFSKAALTAPTPRLIDKDKLFVTAFYNGPMMLKLDTEKPGAGVLWKGKSESERPDKTDGLHSIIPTPVVKDGYIYGICSYGELRCLEAETGKRIWMTMKATRSGENDRNAKKSPDEPTNDERWANAFIIEHEDHYYLFNEHGQLIKAKLSPKGYEEIDRVKLLEPTNKMTRNGVLWMHPAFANKKIFVRNDKEIACFSLAK